MVAVVALLSIFAFVAMGMITVHLYGYLLLGIAALQMGQAGNFKIALIFGAICFLHMMSKFHAALSELKDEDENQEMKKN